MTVLPQALLSLVGGDLLALAFLTGSHPLSLEDSGRHGLRRFHRSRDLTAKLLAGLEHRHELGRDHHFGAAARVARPAGTPLAHLEGAEAADLEVLSFAQSPANRDR